MANNNIDKLVKKLIEESLQEKADELTNKVKSKVDEWDQQVTISAQPTDIAEDDTYDEGACQYHMEKFGEDDERTKRFCKSSEMGELDEDLNGGQKKLDKNKNGKLDKEDFKMLRKGKKSETDEGIFDMFDNVEYTDDDDMYFPRKIKGKWESETVKDKLRRLKRTKGSDWDKDVEDVDFEEMKEGKYVSHRNLNQWTSNDDRMSNVSNKHFDDGEWEEKEYDDYDTFEKENPEFQGYKRGWSGDRPKNIFDKYKEMYGNAIVKSRINKKETEGEMEEGNAFTDALRKTPKGGKFKLGGKTYTDKSNLDEAEKFIQKAMKKMEKKGTEGSFKEYCGGEVTKSCIDKAMKSGDADLIKKANFAKNIKAYKGAEHKKKSVKESFELSESEMIDLIEKIVLEQKKAKGMAETEKVLSANKKENKKAIEAVTKKLKDYLKNSHEGNYEPNPENFPMGNGQLKKQKVMKYNPSEAVEEYIDAFAYPGQTNLRFDEIKPDDKKIDKYLKGDSTTGNAVRDKDGKAYGNVVPSKVGEKFKKNYDENLYGAEQSEASYKRQTQPVDIAGETTAKGSLPKKKSSVSKAQNILNKLDESETKSEKLITEEYDKIKHLMNYGKKTQ